MSSSRRRLSSLRAQLVADIAAGMRERRPGLNLEEAWDFAARDLAEWTEAARDDGADEARRQLTVEQALVEAGL